MFYYTVPLIFNVLFTISISPTQLHGAELLPHAQVDAAVSCSVHVPMLRYPGRRVNPLLRKGTVPKRGKMWENVFNCITLII